MSPTMKALGGTAGGAVAICALAVGSGLGMAVAAQAEALGAGRTLMALADYQQLAFLRDLMLGPVLALAAVVACGRLMSAAPDAEPLRRLGHISSALGAAGFLLLFGSAWGAGPAGVILAAGAICLCFAAGALEGVGLLLRRYTSAGPLSASALRIAGAAMAIFLPIGSTLAAVLVVEHFTHELGWRHAGDDLTVLRQALRECVAPAAGLALVALLGPTLDAIASAARRPFFAIRSTRAALAGLMLLGLAAWTAQLLAEDGPSRATVVSFFSLACMVPLVVVIGNSLATVWYGSLELGRLPWAGLAALACIVERVALALPLALADAGPALGTTGIASAAAELEIVALAFALATALGIGPREPGRPSLVVAGALAFAGAQLALFARLAAATWPRAYVAPALRAEWVASIGLGVTICAACVVAAELVRRLRKLRLAGP